MPRRRGVKWCAAASRGVAWRGACFWFGAAWVGVARLGLAWRCLSFGALSRGGTARHCAGWNGVLCGMAVRSASWPSVVYR
eukprot:11167991-Lingulodinium_polyedra.AAC.1